MLTVGSLFSGIGGLELGLERAGMKTIWQVERDPYARAVLAKNFPGVPCYEDVRGLDAASLARPDVVAGGFPCQPHSLAGKRRASADERDLWDAFADVLRGTRPRWVLAENVPGLLSSEKGAFFGRVLRDLADLGFDAEWTVRAARDVGAPHIRRRVFLLAYPNDAERRQPDATAGRVPHGGASGWPEGAGGPGSRREDGRSRPVADALRSRPQGVGQAGAPGVPVPGSTGRSGWWAAEPAMGRVAHGVPRRVDRVRCLGNAVVPQVAEEIGRLIVAASQDYA